MTSERPVPIIPARPVRFKKTLFCLSGLICSTPLVFPQTFPLSFLALAFCFYVYCDLLEDKDKKGFYSKGFLFFFLYNIPIYSFFLWMHPLDFVGLSDALSLALLSFAVLAVSALHASLFAAIFPLTALFCRRKANIPSALCFGGLWIVCEWTVEQGILGFPWNRLALGQYLFTPFIASASLFGSLFVSLLVVLIGAFAGLAAYKKKLVPAAVCAAILAADLVFGALKTVIVENTVSVTVVQANVLSGQKWDENYLDRIIDDHLALTRSAKKADLILWPETAIPVDMGTNPALEDFYVSLSEELGAPILTGALVTDEEGTKNCVAYIDSDGVFNLYAKRHLVPIGEYLPAEDLLGKLMPFLAQINVLSDPLTPGDGAEVCEAAGVKIGSLVCFDSVFAPLAADSAKNGAELIFLATNDSWYKDSPATTQHLAQSVFRAVENSRSVVIAANSGISAVIDPDGAIKAQLAPLTQGVIEQDAVICRDAALYTFAGDLPVLLLSAVFAALAPAIAITKKIREKSSARTLNRR
ncbi:MAG: apolipoprotein N-acyltransferase [Clostridia bacterium]|nr:apolipoprotein N-acyltransferase [Clostridia bacterium]